MCLLSFDALSESSTLYEIGLYMPLGLVWFL
jgi:hypothetical protein